MLALLGDRNCPLGAEIDQSNTLDTHSANVVVTHMCVCVRDDSMWMIVYARGVWGWTQTKLYDRHPLAGIESVSIDSICPLKFLFFVI